MIDALVTARADAELGRLDSLSAPPRALYMLEPAPSASLVSSVASVSVPLVASRAVVASGPEGRSRKTVYLSVGLLGLCVAALTADRLRDRHGGARTGPGPAGAPESGVVAVVVADTEAVGDARANPEPLSAPANAGLALANKTFVSAAGRVDAAVASARPPPPKPRAVDPVEARH